MTRVGVCAAAGAVTAFGITFRSRATLRGAACSSVFYSLVFAGLFLATGADEATTVFRRFKSSVVTLRAR
jgi:hypothetical protein